MSTKTSIVLGILAMVIIGSYFAVPVVKAIGDCYDCKFNLGGDHHHDCSDTGGDACSNEGGPSDGN